MLLILPKDNADLSQVQFYSSQTYNVKWGWHSTEVSFTLLTLQPWVRISAEISSSEIFLLNTAQFMNDIKRSNSSRAQARDFANAVGGKGVSEAQQKYLVCSYKSRDPQPG